MRFTEFALLSASLAYLDLVNTLARFLVILLITAIVYSILSVSTYILGMNIAISLVLIALITAVDGFLFSTVILTGIISSISIYITSFINILIDVVLLVIITELIRG
jgi:hypothetical protein